jgi:hypothetical protein
MIWSKITKQYRGQSVGIVISDIPRWYRTGIVKVECYLIKNLSNVLM